MPTITTINEDGSKSLRLINGQVLRITSHQDVDPADVPGSVIEAAVQTLNSLADKTFSVNTDPALSQIGRWRALDSIQRVSLTKIAMFHGQLAHFEVSLDKRAMEHLAVPVLAPSAIAIALEDSEIRAFWRAAGASTKAAVLRQAGTDPKCERIVAALLRSPIPATADAEMKMVADTWANVRKAAAADVHERLEGERMSLEWGKQNLAVVAAAVHQLVLTDSEGGKPAVLRILQEDADPRVHKGAFIFGYQASEIGHMQRVVAVERMRH